MTVFAWINLGLAVQMVMLGVLFAAASLFGALFSGDPLEDRVAGGILGALFSIYFLAAASVHVAACVGLLRRRRWGFYLHVAAALMEIFTCWGTTYTIVAVIFALQDDFRQWALPDG